MKADKVVRLRVLRPAAPRRSLTVTLLLIFAALTAVLVPVLCVVAALLALRPGGRGRVIRFGVFLIVYLGAEIVGLAGAFALWVRSGFGRRMSADRYQQANYALLARLLSWLYAVGTKVYGLHVLVPETVGEPRGRPKVPDLPQGPLIVLSRHGGPGDSFLLIHALLIHARRRPRIVLKDTLMLDPLIDVVLSRVPHRFVNPDPEHGDDVAAEIGRLAAGLGDLDVLVVFPEGGNFTPGRRRRAIARLRRRGLRDSAARAQRLRHVLPPRPAGVFAAIDAAPDADVVFVAHTGLDHMESVASVWRSIPLAEPLEATWWTVPATRIPVEEEARLRWLQDNWAEVDAWIDRHRTALTDSA
jgi:1-acyl-sn-glycerol-3-phosphate acyltransferase